jgi:NAD(P)H-nitrite reductase large subunit
MQIAAIGTCAGEGITAITRTGAPAAEYERLFVRDGVIMGAFLINCLRDRPALTDMIAHRMDIRRFMDRLGDMAFDISAALRVK